MDLRRTADGEIVVLHDATVERTTDGSGPVEGLTVGALQRLDAGHRWTADAWRADITGRRLVAWASHFELFFSSAPDPFRASLLSHMARQARHLSRTAGGEMDGLARLETMVLMAGLDIPVLAIREYISSAIDFCVDPATGVTNASIDVVQAARGPGTPEW